MSKLRIVGGTLSGRRIAGPRGAARPTSERAREGLMSALEARGAIHGARVLDLFAATGALSFEAVSRGALDALAVDVDRRALASIRADAEALGVLDRVRTTALDLLASPARSASKLAEAGPFDLVFADPPWADAARAVPLFEALAATGALSPRALVVIEHDRRHDPALPSGLASVASYRYGDTAVTFASAGEARE